MNAHTAIEAEIASISDDMIVGTDRIAQFLGWTKRQVLYAREQKALPIRFRRGVGIYAFKSELVAALKAGDSLP